MSHPLRTTVDDLVEGLKSFERDFITQDAVLQFMEATPVPIASLRQYIFWRESYYTRNLIFRDEQFEVMAVCWSPRQKTVIHSHNGQLGWMSVPEGEVLVHNYKYLSCSNPERQNVIGIDCLAGGHHIELERRETHHCAADEGIVTVDKLQTIHQIENSGKTGCVSLHVYSRPIDSCVAYDLERDTCFRRTLKYYSRYGAVEMEAPAPDPDATLVQLKC